jgi:transcriptional regulator with XRE-family HTH domain
MFDALKLGKKILDRRKAQGLTQEQLGMELGVSAQSVSKWENGETAPDLSLIPAICKVLEISADTLLDVDGGIGIETLARELSNRIRSQKSPGDALMQALKHLHLGADGPTWNPDFDVAFDFKKKRLVGMDLWDKNGFAVFVKESVLSVPGSSEEQIAGIRTLMAPGNWEIALHLLNGPAKEKSLSDAGVAGDQEALRQRLNEMIEAGVLVLDRDGYKLDDRWAIIWTCVVKALSYKVGLGGTLFNWQD